MIDYSGVVFLGILISGLAPITLVIIFCLLTGRAKALFSLNGDQPLDSSPFIRMLMRLYWILLPAYFVLFCVYAFSDLIQT
jgi:hypothetical protein